MKRLFAVLLSIWMLISCAGPIYVKAADDQTQINQVDFTLEDMLDAWEQRDLERLHTYFDTLEAQVAYDEAEEPPAIAPCWQSGGILNAEEKMCHKRLTMCGFLLYFVDAINMFPAQSSRFTLDDLSLLMTYSEAPDKDLSEIGFGYAGHFYDPDTGKNWLNFSSPTAKTQLEKHYNGALRYSSQGNRTKALQELGMALHYLQDINEPHHASNLTVGKSNHQEFEAFASGMADHIIDDLGASSDDTIYQRFRSNSVGSCAHEDAVFAKSFVKYATDDGASKENQWTLAAFFTLANSVTSTVGLLYRFARDTT